MSQIVLRHYYKALRIANLMSKSDKYQPLIQISHKTQLLQQAASKGDLVTIRRLSDQGIDICADNNRALCLAAKSGHFNVVEYLVQNGAPVHDNNNLALQSAAAKGFLHIVKYLVLHGADVTAGNNYAFRMSAMQGNLYLVRYLVSQGAKVENVQTSYPEVAQYLRLKLWLHNEVSELKRLAAAVYVKHHIMLPVPDDVPTEIIKILQASQY